jgi:hypothetical protein
MAPKRSTWGLTREKGYVAGPGEGVGRELSLEAACPPPGGRAAQELSLTFLWFVEYEIPFVSVDYPSLAVFLDETSPLLACPSIDRHQHQQLGLVTKPWRFVYTNKLLLVTCCIDNYR